MPALLVLAAALAPGAVAGELPVPLPVPLPGPSQPEPHVVGGSEAGTARFPWAVALVTTAGAPYCGGTLVAPDRVVTAAHCVAGTAPDELRVVAGRTDMRTDEGVVSAARDVWVHPAYRSSLEGDDVAVVTLDRRLEYAVLPLATEPDVAPPGAEASIVGWGSTEEGGTASPVLRRAEIRVVADTGCSGAYRQYDPGAMLCAGQPQGGADACNGDSGGALVVAGRLVGVTSFGSGCGRPGLPGVYTRVSSYAPQVGSSWPDLCY